jgi:hypothetical protein
MKSYKEVENEKVGSNFPCNFISLLWFYTYKQNYSESFCLMIIKILNNSQHCLAYTRKNYWNILPLQPGPLLRCLAIEVSEIKCQRQY